MPPQVYRLDAARGDELVEIVETMLRDSTPLVLSSAVAAFQEVTRCLRPRTSHPHPHARSLAAFSP